MTRSKVNTRIGLLSSVSLLSLMVATQAAHANPEGGTVEAGSATIVSVSPTDVTITQSTDKAIINWDNFDIGAGETTEFILPSSDSVTLNRDFSGDPSEIYGTLISNGKLYLINRNGILFGSSAVVDVAGLVASTHDISSEDFLNGNYAFTISGDPTASVINQGKITIDDYGIGAFVAPHVRNDGVIVANMGKVSLASASGFAIDLYGDS